MTNLPPSADSEKKNSLAYIAKQILTLLFGALFICSAGGALIGMAGGVITVTFWYIVKYFFPIQ